MSKIFSNRTIGRYVITPYCLPAAWSVLPYLGIKVGETPDEDAPHHISHPAVFITIGWGKWYAGVSIYNPTINKYYAR